MELFNLIKEYADNAEDYGPFRVENTESGIIVENLDLSIVQLVTVSGGTFIVENLTLKNQKAFISTCSTNLLIHLGILES